MNYDDAVSVGNTNHINVVSSNVFEGCHQSDRSENADDMLFISRRYSDVIEISWSCVDHRFFKKKI